MTALPKYYINSFNFFYDNNLLGLRMLFDKSVEEKYGNRYDETSASLEQTLCLTAYAFESNIESFIDKCISIEELINGVLKIDSSSYEIPDIL